VLTTL